MAKRKLLVASVAPSDFDAIEKRVEEEGRSRGEVIALLLREAESARAEQRLEAVTSGR